METREWSQLSLYQFEYNLLPGLIDNALSNCQTVERLVGFLSNADWIFNVVLPDLRLKCDFNTSEFGSEVFPAENFVAIIYTFPTPSVPPLAKYGAIIINEEGVRYYTLENSEFQGVEGWMIGSTSAEGHSNFGSVPGCSSPEEFLDLLVRKGFVEK